MPVRKVILIDRDQARRDRLGKFLAGQGFQTLECADPGLAVQRLSDPDHSTLRVVVADYQTLANHPYAKDRIAQVLKSRVGAVVYLSLYGWMDTMAIPDVRTEVCHTFDRVGLALLLSQLVGG